MRSVVALSAWTLYVWVTRIRNAWTDDDISALSRWGSTLLSLSFVALAVAGLALVWRHRHGRALPPTVRPLLLGFAVWTTLVWVVRSVDIATGGHSAGFVVVHLALGIVSIALSTWAVRANAGTPLTASTLAR